METSPAASGKSLLRFITCGSVDDGKSSLIGRLLYDSNLIVDDHLAAVERASRRHGTTGDELDLALLVDGLESEREQGITIDVAYRYFTTPLRSFVVADTPGHEQFTRNMATGASTADLAIILIDARKGVLVQTKRHSAICSLLGIRHIVLAINKIDLVDHSQEVFDRIVSEYRAFADGMGFETLLPIPVSARYGDNVRNRSGRTPWYSGPTLLDWLEEIEPKHAEMDRPFRFPVQWVNRPNSDFRGYAGTVATGRISVGDQVGLATSGQVSTVSRIATFDGDQASAHAGDAVTIVLADEIDVARGDVLIRPSAPPHLADQFSAHLLWMSEEPLIPGRSYFLFCGTREVPARVTQIKHRLDVNHLTPTPAQSLELNEIAAVVVTTQSPIAFDSYADSRRTGAFVLIDRSTNATVGAGMISHPLRRATNVHRQLHTIDKSARAASLHQTPMILWFTGLSGSGKSTLADLVERALHRRGFHTTLLDGDNLRHGINKDLGFTETDRAENIRRVGEIAKLMVDAGLIVLCCFISPYAAEREMVRELVGAGEFLEIFVDTPLDECIRRDPKGLYRKALDGKIPNFTGISAPYETPLRPDIRIDGARETAEDSRDRIVEVVTSHQALIR